MTVSFALLESLMQHLFSSLLHDGDLPAFPIAGDILAAEYPLKKLRAVLVSLYRFRHGEDSDYHLLRRLIAKAAQLEHDRNQITHSTWAMDPTLPDTIIRFKSTARESRGHDIQREEYDAARFEELIGRIMDLCKDFMFMELHLAESGKIAQRPWPRGYPEGLPEGVTLGEES